MKFPLLEHPGLYITKDFLSKNPPDPVRPERTETLGEGPEPDYERLRTELQQVMDNASDAAASDGATARVLHQNLKLTRREGSDMRFWHYLSLVKFPHYVSWRYFDPRTGKTNKNRYAGLLDDNALSRLWWFADLTLDPESPDPYWRMQRTAVSLEFVKGVVENLFGGNRWLVSGLADALFNGSGRPPDSLVQQVFTNTNVLLVSVAIDALTRQEVHQLVRQLCSTVTRTS